MGIRLIVRFDPVQGPQLVEEKTGEIVENCSNFTMTLNAKTHGMIEISADFIAVTPNAHTSVTQQVKKPIWKHDF